MDTPDTSFLIFTTTRHHLRLFLTERNLDRAIEEKDVAVVSVFIDYDIRMCYDKDLEHMREELGKKYTQRNWFRACYNTDLAEVRTILDDVPSELLRGTSINLLEVSDNNNIELLVFCNKFTMFAEMLFSSNADTEFTKEDNLTNFISLLEG